MHQSGRGPFGWSGCRLGYLIAQLNRFVFVVFVFVFVCQQTNTEPIARLGENPYIHFKSHIGTMVIQAEAYLLGTTIKLVRF